MAGRPKNSTVARLPITRNLHIDLLDYIKINVVKNSVHSKLLRAYTILHHTGMRASELLQLDSEMILDAMETGKFSLDNSTKTKKTRLIMLSKTGIAEFKELFGMELNRDEYEKIFKSTAGGLIRLLNTHIKENLGGLYSSHSYRQGYITDLLKVAPASRVSKLVGHCNVQTTLRYDYSSESDMLDVLEMVR